MISRDQVCAWSCEKKGHWAVQYYLIQLSYTAEAWRQQIERTTNLEERLAAVKQLIAELGGSLAHYRFFEEGGGPHDRPHVMNGKFMGVGSDDVIAIIAFPDHDSATAFSMALSAEVGVKEVRLTPITPVSQAISLMTRAREARRKTRYAAPGGTASTWLRRTRKKAGAGRKRRTPSGGSE